jgi:hypothetical protein
MDNAFPSSIGSFVTTLRPPHPPFYLQQVLRQRPQSLYRPTVIIPLFLTPRSLFRRFVLLRLPASADVFPPHFLQPSGSFGQAQAVTFENNRRNFASENSGNLSVAVGAIQPAQQGNLFPCPSRAHSGTLYIAFFSCSRQFFLLLRNQAIPITRNLLLLE